MGEVKIIFLDIDGVLCTFRSHVGQDQHGKLGTMKALDREAVGLLNVLAEAGGTPVHYVLSSTWRKHFTRSKMTAHLRKFGWRGEFHKDWCTVIRLSSGFRGSEVAGWLNEHPEITEWVAVDDNSDFHPEQKARLVLTHVDDGMSWENFLDASRILHGARRAWAKA